MPPPLLFDLDLVERDRLSLTREQIYEILPHRYEFMVLSGVTMVDRQARHLLAYADLRADDWWVRGHIPERTLLPGALMLEMAGQASAVAAELFGVCDGFLGFGGVDRCKFREPVVPPARLYILVSGVDYRPRRIVSETQGVREGRLVFEARVTGVPVR